MKIKSIYDDSLIINETRSKIHETKFHRHLLFLPAFTNNNSILRHYELYPL